MANENPMGEERPVPLDFPAKHIPILRARLNDWLDGVRKDLKAPERLRHPDEAQEEAQAFERLLIALATRQIVLPDEAARVLDLGEHPRVRVREQLYKGKRKRLKSKDGKRDVPLSPGMARQLLTLRRDEYRGPEAPVFASKAGTPLRPENVYRRALAPAAIGAGFKVEVEFNGERKTRSAVSSTRSATPAPACSLRQAGT